MNGYRSGHVHWGRAVLLLLSALAFTGCIDRRHMTLASDPGAEFLVNWKPWKRSDRAINIKLLSDYLIIARKGRDFGMVALEHGYKMSTLDEPCTSHTLSLVDLPPDVIRIPLVKPETMKVAYLVAGGGIWIKKIDAMPEDAATGAEYAVLRPGNHIIRFTYATYGQYVPGEVECHVPLEAGHIYRVEAKPEWRHVQFVVRDWMDTTTVPARWSKDTPPR